MVVPKKEAAIPEENKISKPLKMRFRLPSRIPRENTLIQAAMIPPLVPTGVMCHASGSPCVKFKLITCLENKNDPQKDPNDSAHILCSVYGGPGAGYILYSD